VHLNRRSFLQVSASSAVLVLAGCGGVGSKSKSPTGSGSSGSLSTQGFGKPDDVGQARIDAFKAAYPNVSLHINEGDFDPQQFLSSVAGGNPPDLVYLDRNLIGSYAAQGALQPLNDLIDKVGLDLGSYRQPAADPCAINGTVYGVPEFYNTRNILINGRALAQAGLTTADLSTTDWNRLHDTARRLYKASSRGISRIGFDPKLPEFLPLWAKANGAELVNDDGSPNLDDAKIVEALDYAHSLIAEQGGWSKFKAFRDTWDVFGSGNELVKDQAGAFPWEGWYVNVLVQASPKLDLRCIHFTDRQGNPISFCDGSAWCVPKGAKNAETAVRWMKTVTATDTWLKAAAAREQTVEKNHTMFTGLWTGRADADHQIKTKYVKPSDNPGFDQAVKSYYESTEYAFAIKPSKASSEIKTAWTDAANRVLSGSQTAARALKQAQGEASGAFTSAK
jgi:multiple sugar transport system substrate-binding protein